MIPFNRKSLLLALAITGSTGAIFGAMPPAPLLVRAGHWEMALQNAARNGNIADIANILDNGRVEVDRF